MLAQVRWLHGQDLAMYVAAPASAILIAVGIHMLWGGNPVAVKFGLEVFGPSGSAFIRFVLGVVVVLIYANWRGIALRPTRGEWPTLLFLAVAFTLQIWLMNLGIDYTTGVNASVLISTNPLFAALFAHFLIAGDRLTTRRVAGLLVAFGGVVLTLVQNDLSRLTLGSLDRGVWLLTLSAALLGLRLVVSARVLTAIEPVKVTVWQMLLSLPVFGLYALYFEEAKWQAMSLPVVLGLLYQGIVIAGVGFLVLFWLMQRYQPGVMMSFNFVAPVAGVFFSGLLLGEAVGLTVIAGVALVAVGLFLIARRSRVAD